MLESTIVRNTVLENENNQLKFAKKTLQDYEVISVIGNGSFGTCFKVRDKETGEIFAWKGMDYDELSESKKESLISEINVLRQLQHPNIVQYYHHLVNHEAKSIFIVMECCEGGDLAQLISKARTRCKRFEEKYIWRVLFQICKALQVCHNKIKQGSILHRDIKPANIFLDSEGNAKLGDFGLARMLHRNESFANTFVGTPYYMSPEIVKGVKYDRKSDVWAVGCLIYEMCALRTPFSGREFDQLSENISNGRFHNIPDVYSTDLQEIIAFMLEVEKEQRPSIEMITRHPIVIRNISDLGNEFPLLIEANQDFYVTTEANARCKLEYSPMPNLSSTMFTEHNSFNEEYGQRRLSVTDVFTPDLRSELFYSVKRRVFPNNKIQQSDPELYESIRLNEYATVNDISEKPVYKSTKFVSSKYTNQLSPSLVTQKVFDQALQQRLHAIRAQEALLKQREDCLSARELLLNEKEKRLDDLERNLNDKLLDLERRTLCKSNVVHLPRSRMPLPEEDSIPPPVPPRKSSCNDDTYCSVESNDTISQQPTMAKLNLASLPVVKAFPSLRKVKFQSPKKLTKYDIENVPNKVDGQISTGGIPMQISISSKTSDESAESAGNRRKSILSILGIGRGSKSSTKATIPVVVPKEKPILINTKNEIIAKCETTELNHIWTKEHKRAAFDLLAAMNAADRNCDSLRYNSRNRFRQSVRERNTLQRNRLRRSLIISSQPTVSVIGTHERIIV